MEPALPVSADKPELVPPARCLPPLSGSPSLGSDVMTCLKLSEMLDCSGDPVSQDVQWYNDWGTQTLRVRTIGVWKCHIGPSVFLLGGKWNCPEPETKVEMPR